jgi:hypothetical protein
MILSKLITSTDIYDLFRQMNQGKKRNNCEFGNLLVPGTKWFILIFEIMNFANIKSRSNTF